MSKSRGQRRRFSGAGPGEHQNRSLGGQHGLALRRIEALQERWFGSYGWGFRHLAEVGQGERNDNQSSSRFDPLGDTFEKVPMVVPDIPVIHSLFIAFFAFPTRERCAW